METIWADWKVVRMLGEGSFGKVYETVRNRFGIEERSAVKVITLPSTPSEANSLRSEGMTDNDITLYYKGLVHDFVQEIALMSKLRGHPNIVGYEDYEVVEHKDGFGWDIYIRMELLTPLTSRMVKSDNQPTSLSEEDARQMAIDLCAALEACADHRIVHRDIKPDNIFVSKTGEYKLGDFGVAKTIDKTVSGLSKKGTYTYMAPEIYKGEPGGLNSDLYSLGIVLYRLLNDGREPFAPPAPQPVSYAQKQDALARRMRGDAFPPPAHASDAMFEIIQKACTYNPADRYQNPAQMRADLRELVFKTAAPPAPPMPNVYIYDNEGTVAVNPSVPTPQPQPQPTPQPVPQPNPQSTTHPNEEVKTKKTKGIMTLAIVLLCVLALAAGGIVLYQTGFFDELFSSSDKADTDDDADKDSKETENSDNSTQKTDKVTKPTENTDAAPSGAIPMDAIELYAAVTFTPTVSNIQEALPDEVEDYCDKEYGAPISVDYVGMISGDVSPDYLPKNLVINDVQKVSTDYTWLLKLEDCGMDGDKITFYNADTTWETASGEDREGTFPLIEYDGSYYSLDTIDMILDVASELSYY